MIFGIGVDILEISRFSNLINNNSFLNKVYTKKELSSFSNDIYKLAANFSAKESISKITKEGFKTSNPNEIEILRDINNAPYVNLYGDTKILFETLGISKIHLSISDTKEIVITYAIGEIE